MAFIGKISPTILFDKYFSIWNDSIARKMLIKFDKITNADGFFFLFLYIPKKHTH